MTAGFPAAPAAAAAALLAAARLAAPGSTATASDAGAAAPGVLVLDAIPGEHGPVRFDHPMHAALAGACADCHHQHPDSRKLDCGDCHAIAPAEFRRSVKTSFLACSACHAELDPRNPSMPSLKVAYHRQCFGCHRGMGSLGSGPRGCTEACHVRRADGPGPARAGPPSQ